MNVQCNDYFQNACVRYMTACFVMQFIVQLIFISNKYFEIVNSYNINDVI